MTEDSTHGAAFARQPPTNVFSIRLSETERRLLSDLAGADSVGTYIRQKIFDPNETHSRFRRYRGRLADDVALSRVYLSCWLGICSKELSSKLDTDSLSSLNEARMKVSELVSGKLQMEIQHSRRLHVHRITRVLREQNSADRLQTPARQSSGAKERRFRSFEAVSQLRYVNIRSQLLVPAIHEDGA